MMNLFLGFGLVGKRKKGVLGAGQTSGQGQKKGRDLVHFGDVKEDLAGFGRRGNASHSARHRPTEQFVGFHLFLDGLAFRAQDVQLAGQTRDQFLLKQIHQTK